MGKEELLHSIVTSEKVDFKDTYGLVIVETHYHPETNQRYRPLGLPSYVLYDAITLRPVYREWFSPIVGTEHSITYREDGLPSRIASHPKRAFVEWTDEAGGTINTLYPEKALEDPLTKEIIGFVYGPDVQEYVKIRSGKPNRYSSLDCDM